MGDGSEVCVMEGVSSTAAWVSAGTGVIAVLVAVAAAIIGLRALRRSQSDARERSRPMVAAELRDVPHVDGSQALVVRNYGPTVARNLRVTFDPEIPEPEPAKAHESLTPFLRRRYADSIPFLTPGQELTNIWFSGAPDPQLGWRNVEPTPNPCMATLTYEGHDGNRYTEQFRLDVGVIRNETTATSSASPEGQAKKAVEHLGSIARSLTAMRSR